MRFSSGVRAAKPDVFYNLMILNELRFRELRSSGVFPDLDKGKVFFLDIRERGVYTSPYEDETRHTMGLRSGVKDERCVIPVSNNHWPSLKTEERRDSYGF